MVSIGQKVSFDPSIELDGQGAYTNKGKAVTGTVVFVNDLHRWFSVEYIINNVKVRTSFNNSDIEEGKVRICGK